MPQLQCLGVEPFTEPLKLRRCLPVREEEGERAHRVVDGVGVGDHDGRVVRPGMRGLSAVLAPTWTITK